MHKAHSPRALAHMQHLHFAATVHADLAAGHRLVQPFWHAAACPEQAGRYYLATTAGMQVAHGSLAEIARAAILLTYVERDQGTCHTGRPPTDDALHEVAAQVRHMQAEAVAEAAARAQRRRPLLVIRGGIHHHAHHPDQQSSWHVHKIVDGCR